MRRAEGVSVDMSSKKILFMVEFGNVHVLVWELTREIAKRTARDWIGGNEDEYTVTPLTAPGDRIKLSLTLFV